LATGLAPGLAATVGFAAVVAVVRTAGVGVESSSSPPQADKTITRTSMIVRGRRLRLAPIAIKSQISCTPSQRAARPVVVRIVYLQTIAYRRRIDISAQRLADGRSHAEKGRRRHHRRTGVSGQRTRYVRMLAHWRTLLAERIGKRRIDRVDRSAGSTA